MNFYFEAAKVLDRLDSKQGSIKGVLSTLPEKDRRRTAALVIETLKYKSVLLDVIVAAKLLKEEKKITSRALALVLVHDLLLSGGIQAGDGPIKQAILRHKTRLNGELQKIKIKRGAKSNSDLAQTSDPRAAQIPRYVRVNTLKWTTEEAVKAYTAQGYQLGDPSHAKQFALDEHVPNLLLFPPQTQFHDDPSYANGKIILQDKASCFPATVLAPSAEDGSVVIDATAAPGNKTSHLSALMGNKGKLLAFERDRRRFATLKTMLDKAGCKNVEAVNSDFLTTNPNDPTFAHVTHILLDPSCSGSGIVNRLDYLLESEQENEESQVERLHKLATFQLMMIRHAMKFPSAEKIVYSTCSIHSTENEEVVLEALKSAEAIDGGYALGSRENVLPTWHRRGLLNIMDSPANADSLVRCSAGEDATNGFFVACFLKQGAGSASGRKSDPGSEHGVHDNRKHRQESATASPNEEGQRKRKRRKKTKVADT